jgi:RecA-family ATPase
VNRLDEAIREGIREGTGPGIDLVHPSENGRGTIEPLFDADRSRFGRFLDSAPPVREYILQDVLPTNVVGLLASMGGAGKSYLAFQLAISATSGRPFLGLTVSKPGRVLCLFAEDDEGELHRRGRVLADHFGLDDQGHRAVAQGLYVVSRVGKDNMLTRAASDGDVTRTATVDRLIEGARRIPDLRLIVVDPVSRFRGGNANNEEHATRFVEVLEEIRHATDATVLGLHHVSQAGIKEGGGQEIVRGSTALVDGVRWVATLQRLRRDQAKDYGLRPDDASRYLRLEIPKSNYTSPFDGLWLRKDAGGVLVPCDLEPISRPIKAEDEYLTIVARLQALVKDVGPLTRYAVRDYCGKSGVLGAGDKTVRAVIERAVRDGSLTDLKGELGLPMEVDG